MDFVSKALESAKALQQTVADAVGKTKEQAQPLITDAVARAQDLHKSILEQAPGASAAAQQQLQTAQVHLTDFIATGKDVLGKGLEATQAGLAPLAEKSRAAVHAAAAAVTEATAPKPPQ